MIGTALRDGRAIAGVLMLSSMVYGCGEGSLDESHESAATLGTAAQSGSAPEPATGDSDVPTARTETAVAITGTLVNDGLTVQAAAALPSSTSAAPVFIPAAALPDVAPIVDFGSSAESASVAAVPEVVDRAEEDATNLEALRIEEQRLEAEREEARQLAAESARLEALRIESATLVTEGGEALRLAAEQAAEDERLAAEREDAQQAAELAAEDERLAAEREDAQQAADQLAEDERLAAEREDAQRAAEQLAEDERLAAELAAAEEERRAAEEEAKQAAEEERQAAEQEESRKAAEQAAAEAAASQSSNMITIGNLPGDARCLDLSEQESGFGSIDKDNWRTWLSGVRYSTNGEYLAVERGSDGQQTLRQKFVPASNGSARVLMGRELDPFRTYRLVQSIYFEPDFDWGGEKNQGGKMGFGFGGGTTPSGGDLDTAGFTARLMWKGNRDGTATARIYSYAADRSSKYGEDITLEGFDLPIGEWFTLTTEITANSATNRSDGSVRVWANGQLVVQQESIGWQTSGGAPKVEDLFYAGFYGGNDPTWAPDRTTYMRVADVCWAAVVDGYSGIDPDAGRTGVPRDRDGSEESGIFSDDNYVATVRGDAIAELEGARTRIQFMMPTDEDVVDGSLSRAVDALDAALDPAHWASDEAASLSAPPVLGLDGAIDELGQPWVIGSPLEAVRSEAASVANDLAAAAGTLAEAMVTRAEMAARVRGCLDGAGEAFCRAVQSDVEMALEALTTMRNHSDDPALSTSHAADAWRHGVAALRGLSG